MHVDGSCHCGSIRFSADIAPGKVMVCHCSDCQKFTGSAFRVGVLDQRNELLPSLQIWKRSALPWVDTLPSVCASEQQEALCVR